MLRAADLLVIVQDDDHVLVEEPGMVHGLVRHAACDGAIADHGQHMVLLALEVAGDSHAQAS